MHAQMAMPMAMTKLADKTVPSPSVTPSTAPSESIPAASALLDGSWPPCLQPAQTPCTGMGMAWSQNGLTGQGRSLTMRPLKPRSHLLSQTPGVHWAAPLDAIPASGVPRMVMTSPPLPLQIMYRWLMIWEAALLDHRAPE